MGNMKSYYDYLDEFVYDLPHGKEREKGIRRAINAALEENNYGAALDLYHEFTEEAVFYDDSYEGLIILPEYTALFDKHPELWARRNYDLMISYKWLSDDYSAFYQIPLEQIERMMQNYASLCDRFGYNKRSYYQCVFDLIQDMGMDLVLNGMTLQEAHDLMFKCNRDAISDCRACEADTMIMHIFALEKDKNKAILTALKTAKPLFTGKLSCTEVPQVTYARFAEYFLKSGIWDEAELMADKAWRIFSRKDVNSPALANFEGYVMLVYAYTNTKKALSVLKKSLPVCWNIKNSVLSWDYYYGFYHIMKQLEEEGKRSVVLNFPDKNAAFYSESNNYATLDLKQYAFDKLIFLSENLDRRNGNTFYSDRLKDTFQDTADE